MFMCPTFAVAHLAFGQPHKRTRSRIKVLGNFWMSSSYAASAPERSRSLSSPAVSPSIQHCKHNRFRSFHRVSELSVRNADVTICLGAARQLRDLLCRLTLSQVTQPLEVVSEAFKRQKLAKHLFFGGKGQTGLFMLVGKLNTNSLPSERTKRELNAAYRGV